MCLNVTVLFISLETRSDFLAQSNYFAFCRDKWALAILNKQLREREFPNVDELKNMKFHHSYIHRVISDHQIRQTSQFSLKKELLS